MIRLIETTAFTDWIARLRDNSARLRIATRIRRIQLGNPGDIKPVGEGVSEMRIHYGPGYRVYRVYLTQRGEAFIVLLGGGNKNTQAEDIAKAKVLAKEDYDDSQNP